MKTKRSPLSKLIILFSLVSLLTACGVFSPSAQQPTSQPSPFQTDTSIPSTETPLPATLTSIPPTPTLAQVGTIVPDAIRLDFVVGATSGSVSGNIRPGQVIKYLVGAAKSQPMMVSTSSYNNDVIFSVMGLTDGLTLLPASQKYTSWQTMLTLTQDYLITVYGGATVENYTLDVITPARVTFPSGAVTVTLNGSTPGGYVVSYIVYALQNQQLDLNLTAPSGNAVLSVYGFEDGQPYLRYVVESTTFSMKLPASQDYIIQVVPRAGQVAAYSLTINIK